MARVMPFRIEALLRAARRHVQKHTRVGQSSVERLQEQLRMESAKVAGVATRAEVLSQLSSVLDAVYALADAHGISADQLEHYRRERRARQGGVLLTTGRLLQPTVTRGLSVIRAGWIITQTHAERTRAAQRAPRPARESHVGDPIARGPGFEMRAEIGPAREAHVALPQLRPGGRRRDAVLALLSKHSSERAYSTITELRLRARLRVPARRSVLGRTDVRLWLRVARDPQAAAERGHPLANLLLATSKSDVAVWIVQTTSRLVFRHFIRPHLGPFAADGKFGPITSVVWTLGRVAYPFVAGRLPALRS